MLILTVKSVLSHKISIAQIILDLSSEFFSRIEGVGEAEICDDNIPILVKKQILKFQVAMNYAFLVEVANT